MKQKRKILVTGFRPFLGESLNPSEILLGEIKKDFSASEDISTLLLPVSFSRAFTDLQEHLAQVEYSVILLLGQAGGRDKICLERVALNWIETEKPDEDGYTPRQEAIDKKATAALFSSFPVTEWIQEFKSQDLPVTVSLSAGGYVCNHVYFKTLQAVNSWYDKSQVVFIHVPYIPEQLVGKPVGTPALDLAIMKKALYAIIAKHV